jgi:hypothetical protein
VAYSLINLGQARAALRLQLGDPSAPNPYWTDAELNQAIVESLRTWQALTGWNRDRATLTTAAVTVPTAGFYDLAAVGVLPAGMFDYNVTDVQVYQSITPILLEPATLPYAGTDQFNQQQILGALIQARDQFLLDTGSVITRTLLTNPAQPISRIPLPQSIIDVRRAAWFATSNGLFTTLWRFDEYQASAFLNSWQTAQTVPVGFSVSVTPPITMQIIPPSNDAATTNTEILSVSTGPTLTLTTGVALGVADNLSYGVKYGTLATLFSSDGQDRDEQRAQYCERRYLEAVNVARLNPSVLEAIFGTTILWGNSLFDEDAYNNSWQNQPHGPPQRLAFAGRNLVAAVPYSDQAYAITLDLVRNMPVPVVDGDFLQIGNEKLNMILNYAQHVASLKMGGQEFQDTVPYYQEFLKAAVLDNNRLNASAFLRKLLDQPAQNQERLYQRLEPAPQPMDLAQTNV